MKSPHDLASKVWRACRKPIPLRNLAAVLFASVVVGALGVHDHRRRLLAAHFTRRLWWGELDGGGSVQPRGHEHD